jgi:hypothetical protein
MVAPPEVGFDAGNLTFAIVGELNIKSKPASLCV